MMDSIHNMINNYSIVIDIRPTPVKVTQINTSIHEKRISIH
jgi:hypothetical protein